MDSIASPYELFSTECVTSQLKQLVLSTDIEFEKIRYEEEMIIDFDEKATKIIKDYVAIARKAEQKSLEKGTFGKKEDDYYQTRKKALMAVIEAMFQNPLIAVRKIREYKEPEPTRGIFLEGYQTFGSILLDLHDSISQSEMYKLTEKYASLRAVFLSFAGMKSAAFVETIVIDIPEGATPLEKPGAKYELPYGNEVQIYELPGKEAHLYVMTNKVLLGLSEPLKKMLKKTIAADMQPLLEKLVDYGALYERKLLEYRRQYLDRAAAAGIEITAEQALIMSRETVSWVLGMGSPIENLALDQENVTDVYIDSENSPLYMEHAKFGTCHTQYRYNREMLEFAFNNATMGAKIGKKLDKKNPLIDAMLTRVNMRVHLQGPPATFGELQGAFRISKPTPFTYPQYLYYKSMSAFFAGYDDMMVSLGTSEGVMGVKGCGKTSFTAAKITAIGTKKRIIPVQDIEEIPTRTYRKYGFHIGAAKVAEEEEERTALSLVRMTSALLRMGEAAVIINELRSRTAIQGIINLLNTQPGIFLLYNFHAESLKDVQDRLELVFGIPAASMFATDRYTFLHKFKFGRKERVFRMVKEAYESDPPNKKFVQTFDFERGKTIEDSKLACQFIKNPEANRWDLSDLDMAKMQKSLKLKFVPPALARRSADTGMDPKQYVLEAFMKGKVFSQILKSSEDYEELKEIGFVLKCNASLRKLMTEMADDSGEIDYGKLQKEWEPEYDKLLKEEVRLMEETKGSKKKKK